MAKTLSLLDDPPVGAAKALPKAGIKPDENPHLVRSELCTDTNAARMFAEEFGAYVRWVPGWGWLFWDGRRWRRDDTGEVTAMAERLGDRFRALAVSYSEPKTAGYVYQWARRVESEKGIRDVLARAEHRCSAPVDQFDAQPFLINCQNVTLDLALEALEGEIPRHYEQASADYLTKIIPHDWNMGAPRPRWNQFIEEIFPDSQMRAFVQRAVGYSLTGSIREQCFFIAWGTGANGKSVFLNTLQDVIGRDYAAQCDPSTFMVSRGDRIRADIARLFGVRFLVALETGEGRRLDEALIKGVTGGDRVVAEHKYQAPFEFTPTLKLWLATNHKPTIHGTDYAIWRRVRLLPFTVTIPEAARDPDLQQKLLREAEGILAWAAEGAVAYMRERLNPPAKVLEATDEYRQDEDILGQFLEDHTVAEPTATVARAGLYRAYKAWAERENERPVSQPKFTRRITERGIDTYKDGSGRRYWIGLGLINE